MATASVVQALSSAAAYTWGNCTYYVAQVASWIPGGLGNAGDWLTNAEAKGFKTSSTPQVGSVAVYGAGGGYSQFGHVAYVTGVNGNGTFDVSEMNFTGLNQVDQRTSTMGDVLGFILPPAGAAGANLGTGGTWMPGASSTSPGSSSGKSCGWTDIGCWMGQLEQVLQRGFWVALGAATIVVGLALLLIEDLEKQAKQAAPAVAKFAVDNPEVLAA